MGTTRTVVATMLSLFLAGFVMVGTSSSASASSASADDVIYRYWIYFQVKDGSFVSSDKGFGATVPADGSIEAYRYAAPATYPSKNLPRADLSEVTFDAVCGDTAAGDGKKRVAVLIDYGVEADSNAADVPEPETYCALVATKATGVQTLAAVEDVRQKKSSFGPLLCAIGGYPATGCATEKAEAATPADGDPVTFENGAAESDSEEDDDSNLPLLLGVGAAVVVIGAGGYVLSRRNKTA